MTEYVTLNNGVKMPVIGYGVYLVDPSECAKCVKEAIEVGYRKIDTAQYYGNEKEVGEGIRLSKIPREQIFVTTKLQTSGYTSAKRSIDNSLKKFGFDIGTYKALEEAYKQGKCKAIGLSNFNEREFLEIYNNFQTKPAVNQIETHLYFNQKKMHKFLEKYNCVHESWSPFGGSGAKMLKNQTLINVAKKYGKTPAQITLRYLLDLNIVVIPKSLHKNRMQENLNVFDFKLKEEDKKIISSLDTGKGSSWPSTMREEFY